MATTVLATNLIKKAYYRFHFPLEKSIDAMLVNDKPDEVIDGFFELDLLIKTEQNRQLLLASSYPSALAKIFNALHHSHILSEQNKKDLANCRGNLDKIEVILWRFFVHKRQKLKQSDFVNIFKRYAVILSSNEVNEALLRLPDHIISLEVFGEIIRNCEQAAAMDNRAGITYVTRYLNNLIILPNQNEQDNDINADGQSTHRLSVHKTASESAIRLKQRYANDIVRIDVIFSEIKEWAQTLDAKNPKHAAARGALNRIAKDTYHSIDPQSQVSIHELLALAWVAIHDDKNRQGDIQDALNNFMQGLYECQRGYNINKKGEDNGREDKPACRAGTFNKIVEKLVSIHPDVEIIFITETVALVKLGACATNVAKEYLTKQFASMPIKEFKELLGKINEAFDVAVIWDDIRPRIEQEMRVEYFSFFGDEKKFQEFVNKAKFHIIDAATIQQFYNRIAAQEKQSGSESDGLASGIGLFSRPDEQTRPDERTPLLPSSPSLGN